jgi:hypothetical protein
MDSHRKERGVVNRLAADHLIAGPKVSGYNLAHNDEYHLRRQPRYVQKRPQLSHKHEQHYSLFACFT